MNVIDELIASRLLIIKTLVTLQLCHKSSKNDFLPKGAILKVYLLIKLWPPAVTYKRSGCRAYPYTSIPRSSPSFRIFYVTISMGIMTITGWSLFVWLLEWLSPLTA